MELEMEMEMVVKVPFAHGQYVGPQLEAYLCACLMLILWLVCLKSYLF